jgi:SAM-dependent methyltransferase
MGTGGGEIFAELCRGHRGRMVATEPWHVNAPIARSRLSPLRVEVARAHSLHLPFRNDAFDLVLNRHEELDPAEMGRVLAPGGVLLTQQVGRNDWKELRTFIPRMQEFGPLFERYVSGFERAGMKIVRSETHDTRVAYRGLGELVYMFCVAPWTIPEFDPLGRDLDALLRLEERLTAEEGLVLTESRFLIEASKPSEGATTPPRHAKRDADRV